MAERCVSLSLDHGFWLRLRFRSRLGFNNRFRLNDRLRLRHHFDNRLNQETSMPGVFAAGDMTGGRMQAATAVGAGASAGISALQYLG